MSAGMNLEEAKVIANKMRFTDAVYNALSAKCVPFRKATKIKLNELLNIAKDVDEAKSKGCDEVELSLYYNGWNDGYKKAIDDFAEQLANKDNIVRFDIDEVMSNGNFDYNCDCLRRYIDAIAEQLKSQTEF